MSKQTWLAYGRNQARLVPAKEFKALALNEMHRIADAMNSGGCAGASAISGIYGPSGFAKYLRNQITSTMPLIEEVVDVDFGLSQYRLGSTHDENGKRMPKVVVVNQ